MRKVCTWAIVIAVIASLELYFGVDDLGGRIALGLLVWSCLSIPVGLVLGRLLEGMTIADEENKHY